MPRIFEKDCKIQVIEYGENCQEHISFKSLKDTLFSFLRRS